MNICAECGLLDRHAYDCPERIGRFTHETPQERYARRETQAAAVRQRIAERAAKSTPLPATWRAGAQMTDELQSEIVAYGTAVALAAINAYRGKED